MDKNTGEDMREDPPRSGIPDDEDPGGSTSNGEVMREEGPLELPSDDATGLHDLSGDEEMEEDMISTLAFDLMSPLSPSSYKWEKDKINELASSLMRPLSPPSYIWEEEQVLSRGMVQSHRQLEGQEEWWIPEVSDNDVIINFPFEANSPDED